MMLSVKEVYLDLPIVESSLSRIWQFLEGNNTFAVISPFRKMFSREENEKRYKKFKEIVKNLGLGYIEMNGGYNEETGFNEEKSLFIPNIQEPEAIKLGEQFDQYSLLYRTPQAFVEIGTNKNSGVGKIIKRFANKTGSRDFDMNSNLLKNFFTSLVKGPQAGRKFVFVPQENISYYKILYKLI